MTPAPSLTGYLLSTLGDVRPPHGGLVAVYTAARELDTVDPREHVLRTAHHALVRANQSVGFGRAPFDVDHPIVVGVPGEIVDPALPRMAVRAFRQSGEWLVENRSTKNFAITITAPGLTISLHPGQPPVRLRSHRQIVCARAQQPGADGSKHPVEHRLTLIVPGLLDLEARPARTPVLGGTETMSTDMKTWNIQQRRTLIGHFYPELVGLPPHSYVREHVADQLLRLPPKAAGQKSRHEKVLKSIRDQAAKATGQPMAGRAGAGRFEQFVVDHRELLEPDLVALHREYQSKQLS